MDLHSILMLLFWLAALGGVVLVGARVIGKTATKAAGAL